MAGYLPGRRDASLLVTSPRAIPLLQATVLIFIVIYLAFALVADILYSIIDPRIRYS